MSSIGEELNNENNRVTNLVEYVKRLIFDRIFDIEKLKEKEKQDVEKYFSFFDELLAYYISVRYPSYKQKLSLSRKSYRSFN